MSEQDELRRGTGLVPTILTRIDNKTREIKGRNQRKGELIVALAIMETQHENDDYIWVELWRRLDEMEKAINALKNDNQAASFKEGALLAVKVFMDDMELLKKQWKSEWSSERGRNAANKKLENDPKQAAKKLVKECWELWQENPKNYRSIMAFAVDMLGKFEHLKSPKKIEDWCREWKKEKITQPAQ